jgi:hypothetical protein
MTRFWHLIVLAISFGLGGCIENKSDASPNPSDQSAELERLKAEAEILRLKAEIESLRTQGKVPQGSSIAVQEIESPKPPPPDLSTPEKTLEAYFAAKIWQDRLPCVMDNSSSTVDRMERTYQNFNSSGPAIWKIISIPEGNVPVGKEIVARVEVGSDADSITSYYIIKTNEGFKIDWIKTMDASEAIAKIRAERETIASFALKDAVMEIQVLKVFQSGPWTNMDVQFTNKSNAFLGYWGATWLLYDKEGKYLGKELDNRTNVKPNESWVGSVSFRETNATDVHSWKRDGTSITVENQSGESINATKYFTINEVK